MTISREALREALIAALDDPAFARAVANRLALPTFPIEGATCPNVTTSAAVTTGYLPYFDSGSGCTVKDSIVFEDAANSRIGIGRTNPQQKLDVYQAGGSTRIQVFAVQSLSPGFRIQQNTRQAIDLYNPVDSDDFRIWVNGAARVAVTSSGNVGVGTTNPIRPLHVKGGDVAVEGGGFGLVDSGMSDPSTVLYEGGSDVTILRTFDVGQSPAPAATLLNIWAPPESGSFPTANRESTLTLQRATNDETCAEYLDLYNNYYPGGLRPSTQYGIRIQKRNPTGQTNAQYHDFVFDQWDGSASAPTTLMALKVSGNVGIGTLSPQTLLDVAGQARVEPVVFSALPAAGSSIEGAVAAVTDSTTNTWGTTIAGGGTNHVLAYCDGTNWTVAGK